jgi:hypothetical protein
MLCRMSAARNGLTWLLLLGVAAGCASAKEPSPDAAPSAAPADGPADATGLPSADVPSADAPAPDAPSPDAVTIDPALAEQARGFAAAYLAWGRVDDELRWAPFLCRIPKPGVAHASASMDADTHGQKLYSVFARDRDRYPAGPHEGQVVVKESWTAEPVAEPGAYQPEQARSYPDGGDHFYPFAQKDGRVFRAAARAGLYLMFKLAPGTPNTDEGWVYATITAGGQVTAAGRVASCEGCHADAEHERLFGVPKAP